MFNLNVDKPTGTATLHLDKATDPRCKPQEKPLRYGYWRQCNTKGAAQAHSSAMGMVFRQCHICFPEESEEAP